jgi:hypothetical protein
MSNVALSGNGHRQPVCDLNMELLSRSHGVTMGSSESFVIALWIVGGLLLAQLDDWRVHRDQLPVFL